MTKVRPNLSLVGPSLKNRMLRVVLFSVAVLFTIVVASRIDQLEVRDGLVFWVAAVAFQRAILDGPIYWKDKKWWDTTAGQLWKSGVVTASVFLSIWVLRRW